MGYWKKKRFNSEWMLRKYSTCSKSFILSTPGTVDVSAIVSFLNTVPGHTKVIAEENFSGYEIFFCYDAPFKDVFRNLKSSLSIPDEAVRKEKGHYRKAVVLFKDGVAVAEYPSVLACAKALNIMPSAVTYTIQGKRKNRQKLDIRYK
jgi:hypothetical protein